jgi:hypothetical protein
MTSCSSLSDHAEGHAVHGLARGPGCHRARVPGAQIRNDGEVREMRDAAAVLEIIRDRGRRGLPLERLYRCLFNPKLFLLAYGKIYRVPSPCGRLSRPPWCGVTRTTTTDPPWP